MSDLDVNSCDAVQFEIEKLTAPRASEHYFAFRGDAVLPCASDLHHGFLQRQAFNLTVESVEQPGCSIGLGGEQDDVETFQPSFLVRYRTDSAPSHMQRGPLLVDIVSSRERRGARAYWSLRAKAGRKYAASQGWSYRVLDEVGIETTALDNIRFLDRYVDLEFLPEEMDWVTAAVRELGVVTFDYLVARQYPSLLAAEGIACLWHMLAARRLDCDISFPLCGETELWVPDGY